MNNNNRVEYSRYMSWLIEDVQAPVTKVTIPTILENISPINGKCDFSKQTLRFCNKVEDLCDIMNPWPETKN